jgi:hypothetical protein
MQEINTQKLDNLQKAAEPEKLNVEKLIKFGILEKEVEPVDGWKITMHPLTQEEIEKVELMTPVTPNMSLPARAAVIKRPTLIWAITKINDEVFTTEEQKNGLNEKFKTTPSTIIDLLFLEYQKLYVEQFDMITQGIKKK